MTSRNGGFTLIELLFVIAVIPILISLLLPAVQGVRELSNQERALTLGAQYANEVTLYAEATGRNPDTFLQVVDFCLDNPDCLLASLQDREDSGYQFHLDAGNQVLEALRARPGLTGSNTIYVDLADGSNWVVPTPGAERERDAAFAAVLARSGELIGDLLATEPGLAVMIYESGDALTPAEVFAVLDANGDDVLDGAEISGRGGAVESVSPEVDRVITQFLQLVSAELALGAGDENPASFGISRAPAGPPYASYSTVFELVQAFVERDAPAHRLASDLKRAQRLQARGQTRRAFDLLDDVARKLDRGVGRWITRSHAEQVKQILTLSTGWVAS